jgi:hypothetical protein
MTSVGSDGVPGPTRLKPTPSRSSPISHPVNIGIPCVLVALNITEGWARDGSADIA